jgi:hypothetical protein
MRQFLRADRHERFGSDRTAGRLLATEEISHRQANENPI